MPGTSIGRIVHMPAIAGLSPEVLAKYQPVIGLEVHVQLLTTSRRRFAAARTNMAASRIRTSARCAWGCRVRCRY